MTSTLHTGKGWGKLDFAGCQGKQGTREAFLVSFWGRASHNKMTDLATVCLGRHEGIEASIHSTLRRGGIGIRLGCGC